MWKVLRPVTAVAALVVFAVPALATGASAATIPTRQLPASGGTIKWAVEVHNALTCTWSSSPEVPGFDGTVTCKNGRVVRPATIRANTSTRAIDYTLTLTVRGETATVDQLKVIEARRMPPASMVPNIVDGQLYKDAFAITFDGLPPLPDVDAIPGDPVYLLAFVKEPSTSTPDGRVTFYVNGAIVPSCVNVPVVRQRPSWAECAYKFDDSGTITLGETFVGTDGSQGSVQRDFAVATPDEVAIIDQECQEALSLTSQC